MNNFWQDHSEFLKYVIEPRERFFHSFESRHKYLAMREGGKSSGVPAMCHTLEKYELWKIE